MLVGSLKDLSTLGVQSNIERPRKGKGLHPNMQEMGVPDRNLEKNNQLIR